MLVRGGQGPGRAYDPCTFPIENISCFLPNTVEYIDQSHEKIIKLPDWGNLEDWIMLQHFDYIIQIQNHVTNSLAVFHFSSPIILLHH